MIQKIMMWCLLAVGLLTSCTQELDPNKPVYVRVETTMGDVTVMLYDDTPLHRDNFIKLCQENAYEGLLFHRIIKDFVVQGGDPASKAHEPGVLYGDGDGGYTVPAEILPNHFNKRGALIDAKESDEVNPERRSAGTQFCFIQGKKWTDEELDGIEERINNTRRTWLYYKFQTRLKQENPAAEYLLGKALLLGEDAPQDLARGEALLNRAIENGHEYAAYVLGKAYLEGSAVAQDIPKAIGYLTMAAEKGAAENTLDAYRRDIEQFFDITKTEPEAISFEVVSDYIRELGRQAYAPKTQARKLSALREFCKAA